jgi:hypothetical protein
LYLPSVCSYGSVQKLSERSRINVNEDYELNNWSKKFGVSKPELKKAVKKVGPMATDVERELKKKQSMR